MFALPVFLISRILPDEWTPKIMGDAWYRILYLVLLSKCQKMGTGWVFRILFLVAAMIRVLNRFKLGCGAKAKHQVRSKIKRFLMLNLRK